VSISVTHFPLNWFDSAELLSLALMPGVGA
jgi:hypothetical protein